MSLLHVDDLTVTATGSTTALLGPINIELAAGEKLGIIGESGSGKSLTALSIMGLLPDGVRASGSVTVDATVSAPLLESGQVEREADR